LIVNCPRSQASVNHGQGLRRPSALAGRFLHLHALQPCGPVRRGGRRGAAGGSGCKLRRGQPDTALARIRRREYTHAMSALVKYLREHPWQRRALTVSMSLAAAGVALVVLTPHVIDWVLLHNLGSADAPTRARAVAWGVKLAAGSPRTLRRLNDALWTDSDVKFVAVVEVLGRLGAFNTPGRDPNLIDRLRLIDILTTRPADSQATTRRAEAAAETRRLILDKVLRSGRDNRYVRRALEATAADEAPQVRRTAALLAARLRDAGTLRKLIDDDDPYVAGWAAIDAALADMKDLAPQISERFDDTGTSDTHLVSCCAYALASLEPNGQAQALGLKMAAARMHGQEESEDRLIYALSLIDNETARKWVADDIPPAGRAYPSAAALAAVARLRMEEANGEAIRAVLRAATADANGLTQAHVLAALQAADALKMPVRREAELICRRFWRQEFTPMLVVAARVLGRQIDLPQPAEANAPSREQCIDTLRMAALYSPYVEGADPNDPNAARPTPLPSAAAAVALWLLSPSSSYYLPPPAGRDPNDLFIPRIDEESTAYLVHTACCSEHRLPSDYIAWHLGRSGRPEAFELGLTLLPPPLDPRVPAHRQPPRNYNANSRACGAMLLALAARTDEQRNQARSRLRARLTGGFLGVQPAFLDRGTYQCALLILGQQQYRQEVRGLLLSGAFPARRAITALCAAGQRAALDWLLWDPMASTDEVAFLLVNTGAYEVLRELVPELPTIDLAAGPDLRNWQTRIMQDYYIIHREGIRLAETP